MGFSTYDLNNFNNLKGKGRNIHREMHANIFIFVSITEHKETLYTIVSIYPIQTNRIEYAYEKIR